MSILKITKTLLKFHPNQSILSFWPFRPGGKSWVVSNMDHDMNVYIKKISFFNIKYWILGSLY